MSASLLLLNLREVRVEMLDSTFLGGEETRQVWDGVTAVDELFLTANLCSQLGVFLLSAFSVWAFGEAHWTSGQ